MHAVQRAPERVQGPEARRHKGLRKVILHGYIQGVHTPVLKNLIFAAFISICCRAGASPFPISIMGKLLALQSTFVPYCRSRKAEGSAAGGG